MVLNSQGMTQRRKPLKRSPLKRLTFDEMKAKGLVVKASELRPKQKPIRKRKPRKDGMTQPKLFKLIWETREHKCEVCGVPIDEPTLTNFSHLLGKGAYPSMKFDPRNVEVWCEKCHHEWTFNKGDLGKWWRVTGKCDALRREANGLTDHTPFGAPK